MAVGIQDPGNLGTVIRTAAAFGIEGLILSRDCADLYHPKTVRGSMGTVFDMPIVTVDDPIETVKILKETGYAVCGSALQRDAVSLFDLPPKEKCCFILGNEGHGLSKEQLDVCTDIVYIPMTDRAESLNVSSAATVLCYHLFAQRKRKK